MSRRIDTVGSVHTDRTTLDNISKKKKRWIELADKRERDRFQTTLKIYKTARIKEPGKTLLEAAGRRPEKTRKSYN